MSKRLRRLVSSASAFVLMHSCSLGPGMAMWSSRGTGQPRVGVPQGAVVLHPFEKHSHTVILLHGTYYDGNEFLGIDRLVVDEMAKRGLDGAAGIKYIFPHSPTNDDGDHFWYDYLADGDAAPMQCDNDVIDTKQWLEQVERVMSIVAQEARELGDPSRVIIGGNSAGGTIAIHVALNVPKPLGGLICLRTCPMRETLGPCPVVALRGQPDGSRVSGASTRMPVFVYQAGQDDTYVPELQRRNYRCLEKKGYDVTVKVNPYGRHEDDDPLENLQAAVWIADLLCRADPH